MVTIAVNEHTKAGRALLVTASILSVKNKGVLINTEDYILVEKMKQNRKVNLLNSTEKNRFIEKLNRACK